MLILIGWANIIALALHSTFDLSRTPPFCCCFSYHECWYDLFCSVQKYEIRPWFHMYILYQIDYPFFALSHGQFVLVRSYLLQMKEIRNAYDVQVSLIFFVNNI
jgi:hypothetical protein